MTQAAATDLDPVSASTMAVLQNHMAAMNTMDPATIAADYAEDCVVMTTFADGPVRGRAGIEAWVKTDLAEMMKALGSPTGDVEPEYTLKTLVADGEYGYLVVELGGNRRGTETYHIRDGKILFESATFFL
ncbi:nuclear transport factor 2 family protein [Gordonia sp. X0973]|uniref:nuclear transport factor 2 family protein n=1 Tax=Gordonia sp. X0973 TaxID=2742602 RepID=UPI000F5234A1|nr:nuclear transport factor 2 family protein [Gordonia sp. X0973]QKT07513.1 nuclear transport factor 2 family protein [Gordonia sp. X0973]